ncbi:hypothetical protein Lal_00046408 [Lupinus albus]|nr:hypothetical protein Lal_00046408 [Lupinus albus]
MCEPTENVSRVIAFDLVISTPPSLPVVGVDAGVSVCTVGGNSRTLTIAWIRLPLSQLDFILAMDWRSANRVMLNYVIIVDVKDSC